MNITDLVFDYGWRKPIIIQFYGVDIEIELVFDAYKNEGINSKQEESYNLFLSNKENYEKKIISLLNEYIENNKIENAEVQAKTILFNYDGSFGLLCNCSWDIENGIAVILYPESKVVIQDNFL
ncbi:hypothetical protein M8853_09540 [Pasteurella multocida]|uniref:DUF6985 domain-containing protein n=1 Tax=Pasteurella multocida TaxID=747 RepID=UPI0007EE0C35|nr:hypothetical protein [Pasteurella multocida]MCL7840534.1 hypothetical protein [Pasteurella multocida]OBP32985.1 hypothetical protein A0R69_09035 [Pasteurella multocida subsp. multocida]PNM10649.1 hypothetical protein A6J59_008305 [Pasteurella multocida]URH91766.1 hypothetical protein M8853_09540 [Pasteurella multocida]URI04491.1 hypothetical protein M8856_09485 [Pasteurella multocida]